MPRSASPFAFTSPVMSMNGLDVNWCYVCSTHLDDGKLFCSQRCEEKHHRDAELLAFDEISEVDLSSNWELPLEAAQPGDDDDDLSPKLAVYRWRSQVPFGLPPPSVASSPIEESILAEGPSTLRDTTSSPRTSFSAASSHSQRSRRGTFSQQPIASSSTLKPALPSLSSRKPAPPRLSYPSEDPSCHQHSPSHSSVYSPHTVTGFPRISASTLPHTTCASTYANASSSIGRVSPTATLPILTPQASLPSLTTRSATASLSSLATPHTNSRPPSHPASRAPSVKNLKHFDDAASEVDSLSSFNRAQNRIKSRMSLFASTIGTKISNWAASDRVQPPYSSSHIPPRELTARPTSQTQRPKVEQPSPAPRAAPSPAPRTPPPSRPVDQPRLTKRSQSPVSMYYPVQGDLVPPESFLERNMREKQQKGKVQEMKQVGRGLVPPRVKSRADLAGMVQRRDDHPAFHNRGRKAERFPPSLGEPLVS